MLAPFTLGWTRWAPDFWHYPSTLSCGIDLALLLLGIYWLSRTIIGRYLYVLYRVIYVTDPSNLALTTLHSCSTGSITHHSETLPVVGFMAKVLYSCLLTWVYILKYFLYLLLDVLKCKINIFFYQNSHHLCFCLILISLNRLIRLPLAIKTKFID